MTQAELAPRPLPHGREPKQTERERAGTVLAGSPNVRNHSAPTRNRTRQSSLRAAYLRSFPRSRTRSQKRFPLTAYESGLDGAADL